MIYQAIARDLLAVLCALQGLLALAIFLNTNHATSTNWPGHARFHVVWQCVSFVALAILECALIFERGPFQTERFYLAAILTGIPMFGFLVAFAGSHLYSGVLEESHAVPPAAFRMFGLEFIIELNLAAELLAVFMLILIVLLYHHGGLHG